MTSRRCAQTLAPVFQVDGKQYALLTPQLAGSRKQHVGVKIADFFSHRQEITTALDLLITDV
ncbi:MAG: CcdB family protein [Gammaproteobacteria bacterium]|nr:CcdB family protein [Gammaproteobacteria bacterium]MBP6051189.1 CcdB family protein [Pseudomonadales bacterium]MBK6581535.1 CcdB family protein [Gammaproteobacteria bacterium]MBK7170391.1 CcdB family protein [Gammaproteobacteria bacterium]MBK7522296.1 CcdB family protein [Gammaproteobacteria bacterium]